jgi:hypothetical protein
MLYQGNGNDLVDGVYERAHLRRRAKKLGLRLVKPRVRRSEGANHAGRIRQMRLKGLQMPPNPA